MKISLGREGPTICQTGPSGTGSGRSGQWAPHPFLATATTDVYMPLDAAKLWHLISSLHPSSPFARPSIGRVGQASAQPKFPTDDGATTGRCLHAGCRLHAAPANHMLAGTKNTDKNEGAAASLTACCTQWHKRKLAFLFDLCVFATWYVKYAGYLQ